MLDAEDLTTTSEFKRSVNNRKDYCILYSRKGVQKRGEIGCIFTLIHAKICQKVNEYSVLTSNLSCFIRDR